MPFYLRTAREEDLSVLARLVEELGYSPEGLTERFAIYSTYPDRGIWVVEEFGEILGLLAFHRLDCFHSQRPLFRIVSLVVGCKYRRRGVGKELLYAAEKEAIRCKCEAIELTSAMWRQVDGSHDFYLSEGYQDSVVCSKRYLRKNLLGNQPEKSNA